MCSKYFLTILQEMKAILLNYLSYNQNFSVLVRVRIYNSLIYRIEEVGAMKLNTHSNNRHELQAMSSYISHQSLLKTNTNKECCSFLFIKVHIKAGLLILSRCYVTWLPRKCNFTSGFLEFPRFCLAAKFYFRTL